MNVFKLHRDLIGDYVDYTRSFLRIADARIAQEVEEAIDGGLLWPNPLLQLNPSFETGELVDDLVAEGVLHPECGRIFRIKSHDDPVGRNLRLHWHQAKAVRTARDGKPYILTTGTGSGKSLAYIIPAVDHVLRNGPGKGIQAIIVYPMNALANSQEEELLKFLGLGYPQGGSPVSFERYTGQEDKEKRERIRQHPPDILLTNYMMLELMLTRVDERDLVRSAARLRFLVLDELHTYRGRQGADVGMLVRRCRDAFSGDRMLCVGTSATMASEGLASEQAETVARVGSKLFGTEIHPEQIIGESLRRTTQPYDFSNSAVLNLGLEVPYRYGSEMRTYIPDFIVLVDDGRGEDDLLHLIVEIKGYRREDAKEKKSTMDTYWVPGVNHKTYGRWAFAEFTEVYQISSDFEARVEAEFNQMMDAVTESLAGEVANGSQ